ncbi:SET and MYND domain-containing protein 4 [Tyrophagus putrescentiae]|nr:SET and MYND domain-containing protein 4 [Tyrophagus putrescentiae]
MSILYAQCSQRRRRADKSPQSGSGLGNRSATFFEIGQWASVLADMSTPLRPGHQAWIISSLSTFSDHPYEPRNKIPSLSRKWREGASFGGHGAISPGEILAVELPYASVLVKKEELSYCHHCCRRLKTDQFAVLPEEHNLGDKLGNCSAHGRQVTVREGGSGPVPAAPPCSTARTAVGRRPGRRTTSTSAPSFQCSTTSVWATLPCECSFTLNSGDNGNGNGGFSQAKDVIRRADHDQTSDGDKEKRLALNQTSEPPFAASMHLQVSYGVTSGLLLELATRVGYLSRLNLETADDVHLVGGLLHRHLMQLSVNAHAINDYIQAMPEEGGSQLNADGSFCCAPLAPIAVGEEVVNSYCVHFARMEVKERQERLLDRYNFVCKCPRCELELKDGLNGRYIPLKCKSCPNGLMTRKDEDNFHCNACSKTVPQEEIKRQYNAFTEVLEKAWKSLKLDKPLKPQDGRFALTEKAADQAQAMLATRLEDGTVVFGSSRAQLELGRIADLLANMYLLYGRPADATRLIKRSRAIVEAIYGPMAILLVHELSKEVDILARLLQADVIVPLLRGGREATEREVALIDDWKQQYKRMMTLMGRYSLSGARLPLGDPDSCYFTSQILQRRKWMKEFDGVLRSIVEKRQLRNAAGSKVYEITPKPTKEKPSLEEGLRLYLLHELALRGKLLHLSPLGDVLDAAGLWVAHRQHRLHLVLLVARQADHLADLGVVEAAHGVDGQPAGGALQGKGHKGGARLEAVRVKHLRPVIVLVGLLREDHYEGGGVLAQAMFPSHRVPR